MARDASLQEQAEMYDVTFHFSQGKSIKQIAELLRKSRQKVSSLLQMAFTSGLVQLPIMAPTKLTDRLEALYPRVDFCVINSSRQFFPLAARQALAWIRMACRVTAHFQDSQYEWTENQRVNDRCTYVAIGGGTTMRNVAQAMAEVSRTTDPDRKWLDKQKKLCFVNATAGGLPREPTFESSYVACHLAQALGQGQLAAAVFSLSGNPSNEEAELVECAVKNTALVISGIGEPQQAYCTRAMSDRGILAGRAESDLVGEFLFHPFDCHGKKTPLLESAEKEKREAQAIEIKEATLGAKGTLGDAMLATLLRFESLHGRPATNPYWNLDGCPRYVAAIADCAPENAERKAQAVNVLLENGLLTHLCISLELAEAMRRLASSPE